MNTVASLLARKNKPLVSVSPSVPVIEALGIMAEKNIGSVIVMDGDTFKGVVTERDYSRKVALKGKSSSATTVAEIMSTDLVAASPSDSIDKCMAVMTEKNIRYMPVFNGGKLTGIVSMSDVVKETILMQQETINHLKEYISL